MTFSIYFVKEEGEKEDNRCVGHPNFLFEQLDNIGEKIVANESVEC
jgi:hypothetical protein